jgi:hypothetical protein
MNGSIRRFWLLKRRLNEHQQFVRDAKVWRRGFDPGVAVRRTEHRERTTQSTT